MMDTSQVYVCGGNDVGGVLEVKWRGGGTIALSWNLFQQP